MFFLSMSLSLFLCPVARLTFLQTLPKANPCKPCCAETGPLPWLRSAFLPSILPEGKRCPGPGVWTSSVYITTVMGTRQPGPKVLKIVRSSEVEGLVSAARLPSNLILWHTGTSLQEGTTCLCTAELSHIALNSHSKQKVVPHLDTHFQVMILYVPFFTNIFPEGIQSSSEFPHRGTSCLRVASEDCWNGCKGTCPFSFPFFFHIATLIKKPPVNGCFL